jgi:hypothetical protein
MKKRSIVLLIALLGFSPLLPTTHLHAQTPAAEIAPAKKKEIEKLLELMGMTKLMTQMVDQMMTAMKGADNGVPDEFWVEFRSQVKVEELIGLMLPIYDKYYTLDDLKAVNAFYSTDVGKRMLTTMPQVMAEATEVGQKWGKAIGEKVAAELTKRKKT